MSFIYTFYPKQLTVDIMGVLSGLVVTSLVSHLQGLRFDFQGSILNFQIYKFTSGD